MRKRKYFLCYSKMGAIFLYLKKWRESRRVEKNKKARSSQEHFIFILGETGMMRNRGTCAAAGHMEEMSRLD